MSNKKENSKLFISMKAEKADPEIKIKDGSMVIYARLRVSHKTREK